MQNKHKEFIAHPVVQKQLTLEWEGYTPISVLTSSYTFLITTVEPSLGFASFFNISLGLPCPPL